MPKKKSQFDYVPLDINLNSSSNKEIQNIADICADEYYAAYSVYAFEDYRYNCKQCAYCYHDPVV